MRSAWGVLVALAAAACGSSGSGGADAGVAPDTGVLVTPDAGPGVTADYVFDETVVRSYNLTVDPADWQWLNDNAQLEQYVPAELEFEGQTYAQIGVRYKGSYGTLFSCFDGAGNRICPKLSIKLKFNEYVAGQKFYGLKKVNFHSMKSDPSQLHEAIGYTLYRNFGVYAPRSAYARITVNGELLGLFSIVEAIDGRFTRDRFADGGEGNLYKEIWPSYDTEGPYLAALKTNEDTPGVSAAKMVRFANDLAASTNQNFRSVLSAWMDIDALMRQLAVDRLIDHWDGIVAWYCNGATCTNHNYYFYEEVARDRIWLVPWDLDNTFAEPSPIRTYYNMPDWDELERGCAQVDIFWGLKGLPPYCDNFIGKLVTVMWDDYAAATRTLLDDHVQLSAINARIDALAAIIRPHVMVDPNGPNPADWEAAVQQLKSNIAAKRAYIEAKLAP